MESIKSDWRGLDVAIFGGDIGKPPLPPLTPRLTPANSLTSESPSTSEQVGEEVFYYVLK